MPQHQKRIQGLEYGRAIATLFVVFWHEHIFGRGRMFDQEIAFPTWPSLSDVLYSNVLLQAVPFFIFISCFLYASKDPTWPTLKARTKKLTILHCFWAISYFLILGGIPALLAALSTFQSRPLFAIFTGMGSYYFFSALLVTTLATHFAARLKNNALWVCLGITLLGTIGMQFAAIAEENTWTAAFWNPVNYLPAAPAAIILVRHCRANQATGWLVGAGTVLFILSATIEWLYLPHKFFTAMQGYAMPAYTRISPIIFACVATLLLLKIRGQAPRFVTFLAKYSLSVYCLQGFVITGTSSLSDAPFVKTAVDLFITYGVALLLHKAIFKDGLLATDRH